MRARAPLATVLVAATISLGASCGGNASTTGVTTTVDALSVAANASMQRLAGRYAHYDVVAYQSADMKTLIISYGFTDLALRDGSLIATETFCHAEHRSDQPITTTMADAATTAIRPASIAVTLSDLDGRVRVQRPATPTGIGIHFNDPVNDVLPTDPTDPRIVDDDHDGNPGITAHIKITDTFQGDLFIARREIFAYDVLAQDDGSLTGTVTDHSEQLIVGATNDLFITRAPWVQYPDLTRSPILLKPVATDWDCARLMQERPTLFPPTPAVDW